MKNLSKEERIRDGRVDVGERKRLKLKYREFITGKTISLEEDGMNEVRRLK